MYSPILHKHFKTTAFVLMLAWGITGFAQNQDLKCKEEAKEISFCSKKSPPIITMAAKIVKACNDEKKNDLTLVQAKAVISLGIVYLGTRTIPEFEAQLEKHKKSVAEYEALIKKINDKIDHYDEWRSAYLAFYEPLIKRRNKINELLQDDKTVTGKKRGDLYKEASELNQKIYEVSSSPKAATESKERYQEMLKSYKQSQKQSEELVAKTQAMIEELKKTPEKKRDELLVADVKSAIQKSADEIRKRPKYKECGFTDFEIVAISYYSGSGYTGLNQALRSSTKPPNEAQQSIIDGLNSGLDKIANITELVKRGTNLPEDVLSQHCMGCIVTYPSFTSTSLGTGFGGTQRFIISPKQGKYIAPLSSHSSEEEVLFKTNTHFKVLNIEGNNYTLKEVD